MKNKILTIVTTSLLLLSSLIVLPIPSEGKNNRGDGKTEYWAVLIGVDCYRPLNYVFTLPVEKDVEYMYKTLLVSDHWQEDHIKIILDKNATRYNIVKALRWLDRMDDGDDISLIYYTGHGYYLNWKSKLLNTTIPIDLPPFDEKDRCDEYLTTYLTMKNPFAIITDDLLNRLLNRLDSKGVAVILDSCYSGGMSDINNSKGFFGRFLNNSVSNWVKDFSRDIRKKERVTLMASRENESAYMIGWKGFGSFVSEGLQGYADSNNDTIVSAEEAFNYAAPKYFDFIYENCIPTIDDQYLGELFLTNKELPPSKPVVSSANGTIGSPGQVFVFNASSKDPENDTIRYGWNWRDDSISERWDYWGYNAQEWSNYYNSRENCTMTHSWEEPGVYTVRVKAQDEHGAEIIPDYDLQGLWTKPIYILIPSNDETVDQYQLRSRWLVSISQGQNRSWAQSFTPNSSNLSKIKLNLGLSWNYEGINENLQKYPLNISIRKSLNGVDLVKISEKPYTEMTPGYRYRRWIEFDFPNLTVNPEDKYYILVTCDSPNQLYYWIMMETEDSDNDPYTGGDAYNKYEGHWDWETKNPNYGYEDFCFITYK